MPEQWQSRIVESADVDPSTLVGNPRNWRLHAQHQRDALTEALDKVGWVQPVIVNKRTGHLVDGHLRVMVSINRSEPTVPVSYVDLSESEERLVLATLDPIAALAGTDEGSLKGLLSTLEGDLDVALAKMLDDVSRSDGSVAQALPSQDQIDQRADQLERRFDDAGQGKMLGVICPDCGKEFAINLDELRLPVGS